MSAEELANKKLGEEEDEDISMEEVLSSIRRILSEEDENAGGGAQQADDTDAEKAAEDVRADSAQNTDEDANAAMRADEVAVEAAPNTEPKAEPAPAPKAEPAPAPKAEPAPAPKAEPAPQETPSPATPMPPPPNMSQPPFYQQAPANSGQPMDWGDALVMDLTPNMEVPPSADAGDLRRSTDVLTDLAKAILDRRDLKISSGNINGEYLTIEGMIREMLKPMLREWMDRNLPYLIERLAKREIEDLVNRAQGLDIRMD